MFYFVRKNRYGGGMKKKKTRSEARKAEWSDPDIRERRRQALSEAAIRRYRDLKERLKSSLARKEALTKPSIRKANARVLEKARASKKPTHGLSDSPEYKIWAGMVQRCMNSKNQYYQNYGGRGISVCSRWTGRGGFDLFIKDVGHRPTVKHTIGRIDNDGDYKPGNVRWEFRKDQMRNFRRNRMVTIAGETCCLAEWAERIGISGPGLAYRLSAGWSDEDLLRPGGR